jgi:DUF2934 family protein
VRTNEKQAVKPSFVSIASAIVRTHDAIGRDHAINQRHEVCRSESMAKNRRKTEDGSTVELASPPGHSDRDRVAVRAYELYEARGRAEGQELDDWLSAERELNSEVPAFAGRDQDDT